MKHTNALRVFTEQISLKENADKNKRDFIITSDKKMQNNISRKGKLINLSKWRQNSNSLEKTQLRTH